MERELVNALKAAGLDAERIPLSGATSFAKNDVRLDGYTFEVKARQNGTGFSSLHTWLEKDNADFLALRQNGKPFLVAMDLETFIKLYQGRA